MTRSVPGPYSRQCMIVYVYVVAVNKAACIYIIVYRCALKPVASRYITLTVWLVSLSILNCSFQIKQVWCWCMQKKRLVCHIYSICNWLSSSYKIMPLKNLKLYVSMQQITSFCLFLANVYHVYKSLWPRLAYIIQGNNVMCQYGNNEYVTSPHFNKIPSLMMYYMF